MLQLGHVRLGLGLSMAKIGLLIVACFLSSQGCEDKALYYLFLFFTFELFFIY